MLYPKRVGNSAINREIIVDFPDPLGPTTTSKSARRNMPWDTGDEMAVIRRFVFNCSFFLRSLPVNESTIRAKRGIENLEQMYKEGGGGVS